MLRVATRRNRNRTGIETAVSIPVRNKYNLHVYVIFFLTHPLYKGNSKSGAKLLKKKKLVLLVKRYPNKSIIQGYFSSTIQIFRNDLESVT